MKGQIELSMLTRFAMVFFIMSLAAIVVLFSNTEQRGLCKTQASLKAQQIASSINQVLISPAEDQRTVIPLEASLSVGGSQNVRYYVNITNRDTPNGNTLVVGVQAADVDCSAFQSVGYEDGVTLTMQPPDSIEKERFGTGLFDVLKLNPTAGNPAQRTRYLIVLKCTQKQFTKSKYLYLESCFNSDPNSCLNFPPAGTPFEKTPTSSADSLEGRCGFEQVV